MTRVLRRPMFRMGGNTDQGIMSGVVPRPGYQYGELVKQLPELQKIAKEITARDRRADQRDFAIDFGLGMVGTPPSGNILTTAANIAQAPYKRFVDRKAAQRKDEGDLFKTLIEAQGDIMGGEGGAKWQKQWEAEQIPGLVNRISELADRQDLSNEERNELKSKRILLDKYSPEDPFTKFFLSQPKIGLGLFKKIKADLIAQDQRAATKKYKPELGEDAPQLITDSFKEFRRQVREMRATGGRVGYQEGMSVMPAMPTAMPTQTDAMPEELSNVSYEELRARLPQEVSDEIVTLLANSAEALEDFAVIQTEQDIANFNKKYGVNLVLPSEA